MAKLIPGKNDLATLHPEVAAEADGWDPSKITAGSGKKLPWKCKEGHRWEVTVSSRISYKTGCPYCSNYKILVGFNDLKTKFPEVAKDADGWDPTTIGSGNSKSFAWKCEKGHTWKATPKNRTTQGQGCPVCSNHKVWKGFNDLQTKFPEIAEEADGWDPSTVLPGSGAKMSWKCKEGHVWIAALKSRTSDKRGCPVCSNQKLLKGFNDLQTRFPEVAKEADGWDPSSIVFGTHTKKQWKCSMGHTWSTTIVHRTAYKSGCPVCANQKVLAGFNDLKTKFPDIAKQADGWDPSTVLERSPAVMPWKCEKGHTWKTRINSRSSRGLGCPVCSNQKLWVGFNDLQTRFPEVAKEADGWDPSTVLFGTIKRMPWKCEKGHKWSASLDSRTRQESGCPVCAETGFNPDKPAWFYLMKREGEQQFGITNVLSKRMQFHARFNWIKIEVTGPHQGQKVLDTENKLKKWLKKEVGLIPDKQENWCTSKMEVHSLAELKEKSGIETSIF